MLVENNAPNFIFKNKLGEDYYEVLWYILENGEIYVSEREQPYLEAEPITITVIEPVMDKPSKVLPQYIVQRWGEQFIFDFATRVAWCIKEPGMWSYSYGERLAYKNQIENIIKKLKNNPDTRQATAVLYRPEDTSNPEPPCWCIIDFKIRNGKLRTFAWLRSNDMENGYPPDYYAILMLSFRVSEELGVKIGRITTRSESAHIYIRTNLKNLRMQSEFE